MSAKSVKNGTIFIAAVLLAALAFAGAAVADAPDDTITITIGNGKENATITEAFAYLQSLKEPTGSATFEIYGTITENAGLSTNPLPGWTYTFIGKTPDATIDMSSDTYWDEGYTDVVFKDLCLKYPNRHGYVGIVSSHDVSYDNCTIEGLFFTSGNNLTFSKCHFKQDVCEYHMWVYASYNTTFRECTFDNKGKAVKIYNEGSSLANAFFEDCVFNPTDIPADKNKSAIEMDLAFAYLSNVYIENCTVNNGRKGLLSNNVFWNHEPNLCLKSDIEDGIWYSHYVDINFPVHFDANGGTAQDDKAVTFDAQLKAPESKLQQYGIYDSTNEWYSFNEDLNKTYAFELNTTTTYGDLPTPTQSGYAFQGWFTEKEGGNQVTADTVITAENATEHTLYAHWQEAPEPVARIGGTDYASLEDAVNASKNGDTITLLKDVDLTKYVSSGGVPGYVFDFPDDVTLDLAGYNITSNNFGVVYQGNDLKIQNGGFIAANKGSYALFVGDETPTTGVVLDNLACTGGINIYNANVTIQDSYSTSSTNVSGQNYYAIWCDEDGHAIVKSGEFTSSSEQAGTVLSCSNKDPAGSILIEGGVFYAPNGVKIFDDNTKNLITVTGGTFSDDTVKSHLLTGYLARESLLLEGYYEVVPGAEPTIEIQPTQNESGATDIPITPTEHTNVTVDSANNTTTLTDNATNVEITIQFSDMTKSGDTVSGNVSSIKATYPELQAITEEETTNIPIALSLDLNEPLTGTIVLPRIDTEYNSIAAAYVDSPIATVTGLPNGDQTIEQINNNITQITLTFIDVRNQFGANENPVIYHVSDAGETTEITEKNWSGNNLTFTSDMKFSSYVLAKETGSHYVPIPSSSHETGYTVILSDTATPTPTPTATPSAVPTHSTTNPTQKSPAPFVGIIAGLVLAGLVCRLRR